jgi:hyperosmotically inducible protein
VRIKTEVRGALIGDKDIWSTNIDIATVQCDVVLLGIVGKDKEIADAVAHAKAVDGVQRVKSFLRAVRR